MLYLHGKQLRSCWDGYVHIKKVKSLSYPRTNWEDAKLISVFDGRADDVDGE